MLKAHGVTQLVDIRSIRRSRTNPQFDESVLAGRLARHGISYQALPALGGRRGKAKRPPARRNDAWDSASFRNYADHALTPEFERGLAELLALAEAAPTAIMCAEAVWWRCHRRIVADHLLARRVPVTHLLSETSVQPATLTPFAVATRGRVYYPLEPATRGGRLDGARTGRSPRSR